jgi:hypothetical protein
MTLYGLRAIGLKSFRPKIEGIMRQNTAIAVCLLSLGLFAVGYQRLWMSLSTALIFASAVWQLTGLWLVGQLKATLTRKVLDRTKPLLTPLAGTMLKGSTVLFLASITAWIVTGVN